MQFLFRQFPAVSQFLESRGKINSWFDSCRWKLICCCSEKLQKYLVDSHLHRTLCRGGDVNRTQAESFIWLPTHISKARGIKTDKLGSFFFYHFFLVGGPRECLIKVLLAAWVADFSSLIFTCILIFILRWNHFLSGLWESSFHLNFHFGCAASSRGKATVVSAFKC